MLNWGYALSHLWCWYQTSLGCISRRGWFCFRERLFLLFSLWCLICCCVSFVLLIEKIFLSITEAEQFYLLRHWIWYRNNNVLCDKRDDINVSRICFIKFTWVIVFGRHLYLCFCLGDSAGFGPVCLHTFSNCDLGGFPIFIEATLL